MIVTRFAPSPNGPLHLGHAFSAINAYDLADDAKGAGGGRFLLRIEDIDGPRSRPELPDEFRKDLEWLGLEWGEVPAQSERLESYGHAAAKLRELGLLYRCGCTRSVIFKAQAKAGITDNRYPGTCRENGWSGDGPAAWRLDSAKALEMTGDLSWEDVIAGTEKLDTVTLDDVVLVRKDAPASYHLAGALDDAADGVTLVTRGKDLFAATRYHRLLQALLGLPQLLWRHHPLLLDEGGEKLAKRRGSPSLSDMREAGDDGRKLAGRLRAHNFPAGISLGNP